MLTTEFTIEEIINIANALIKFYGVEASLFFAILTFFWKNKKLSEHKGWILWSLSFSILSIFFIGLVYYDSELLYIFTTIDFLEEKRMFYRLSLVSSFLGILFVPLSFLSLYLKAKSFRSRNLIRHYYNLYVRNKTSNDSYISSMQPRDNVTIFGRRVDQNIKNSIKNGCSFLIISDDIASEQVKKSVINFLLEGLENNETINYVTVDSHPSSIKQTLDTCAENRGINLNHYAKDDFIIIDSFSPNCGYDEDVLMKNSRDILNEIQILKAKSIIDIHSVAMDAWYIHKKRLLKDTGKLLRRPHRMVYDHLSVLLKNTTIENLVEYFTHFVSAERSYGMFTVIIEYTSTNKNILSQLKQLVDCVLIAKNDPGDPHLELIKLKSIRINSKKNKIKI